MGESVLTSEIWEILESEARRQGVRVYLVGGMVRDLLSAAPLGRDIDLVVDGSHDRYVTNLGHAVGGTLKRFPSFLTAKLVQPACFPECSEIDVAAARTEIYPHPGALPVVRPAGINEDLRRRDFTINAMAVPLDDFNAWRKACLLYTSPSPRDS